MKDLWRKFEEEDEKNKCTNHLWYLDSPYMDECEFEIFSTSLNGPFEVNFYTEVSGHFSFKKNGTKKFKSLSAAKKHGIAWLIRGIDKKATSLLNQIVVLEKVAKGLKGE